MTAQRPGPEVNGDQWTVRGQVITPKGDQAGSSVNAGPVFLQPEPRSQAGYRRRLLPELAAAVLADRHDPGR